MARKRLPVKKTATLRKRAEDLEDEEAEEEQEEILEVTYPPLSRTILEINRLLRKLIPFSTQSSSKLDIGGKARSIIQIPIIRSGILDKIRMVTVDDNGKKILVFRINRKKKQ